MEILKSIFDNWFGKNEGLELIAERLRSGVPYVKAYARREMALVYFKGTGRYLGGRGINKRYDVHYQVLGHKGNRTDTLSDWNPVDDVAYMRINLMDLEDSDFHELRDQEGENDREEVIAWLKKIASRLKPHQYYKLHEMAITNEIFSGDNIRLYVDKREILVPLEYMGNRRLITSSELGAAFDPNQVGVFDDTKIDRKHRKDTDPKRWYEIKKVDSVNDKHAIRLTHRKTAHAPIHYYAMEIIADSKAAASRPFYVKELLVSAIERLAKDYKIGDYQLDIFTDAIDFTWDGKTVPVGVYCTNQSKYPASVDTQPLLVNPPLKVLFSVYMGTVSWRITTDEETETCNTIAEKETAGRKRP